MTHSPSRDAKMFALFLNGCQSVRLLLDIMYTSSLSVASLLNTRYRSFDGDTKNSSLRSDHTAHMAYFSSLIV